MMCRVAGPPLPSLRPSLLQALAGAAQESGAWRLTRTNGTSSDRDDADSRVASAQQPDISEIVRQDAYRAAVIRQQFGSPVGWAPEVEDEMVKAALAMFGEKYYERPA